MKESISMGQIQATGNYPDAVPAKMLGGLKNGSKGIHSRYNILFSFQSVLCYAKENDIHTLMTFQQCQPKLLAILLL